MKTPIIGFIKLLRPFTLLAPIIVSSCVMIASFVYNNNTVIDISQLLPIIIPASITFALLNGASNALNQATDIKEDKISKSYRPIPNGDITQKEAHALALILYIGALLLSFTVHTTFSIFIFIISIFSITYSLPPRLKRMLFINQLWVAIPRGLLGIMGSWCVFGNPFHNIPISIGIIAALFLFGGTVTKDITDEKADKESGIKTLINVFGIKTTAIISLIFMTISFSLIIPLIFFNILEIYLLPLTSLSILAIYIVWRMTHSQINKKYENTSAWTLMYTTYFIFAVGFAILTIFSA